MAAKAPFILSLLLLLLLTGCARQRWSEPLQEEESLKISEIITAMQDSDNSCPKELDCNALIFWKNPMSDTGINGYLQLKSPSSAKFIVSNPFGMLVYAFASDGKTFQILDTGKRQHIRGNLHNLAIRKEFPLVLAQGEWFAFLGGQLPTQPIKAERITKDLTNQTVWVLLRKHGKNSTTDEQWVNLDINKKKVLKYLFLNRDGETIAEISYENLGEDESCLPANKKIYIKNLPWSSEIEIELQDIRTDKKYGEADFSLPVPVGYFKQLQP